MEILTYDRVNDSLFLFFCYINQLPVVEWIVPEMLLFMYYPTPNGVTYPEFIKYDPTQTACSGVECTQNVIMYHWWSDSRFLLRVHACIPKIY
jgi:hypothetical protein